MELETPAELNDRLVALQPVPGAADFLVQAEIYAQAVSHAQAVLKERETDPLGQAAGAGAIELEPIDFASPEGLASSLALRAQQGDAVAAMYGTPTSYFRPAERTSIANSLLDNPAMLPGFAASVAQAFGDGATTALSELSDAGPELAHVAGLALVNGDTSVAAEVARVLSGRRDKSINVKMPTEGAMANAAGAVMGSALMASPATQAAALNTAAILLEGQAAALGFDPADIKDQNSAAYVQWERAVNRALGARLVNGQQYGGLVPVNGQMTVAPTDMKASDLQNLIWSIADQDLAALPPIGGDVPLRASSLHDAALVSVGNGKYQIALGDPFGWEPQFLAAPDGSRWVLDMAQLQEVVAQRVAVTGRSGMTVAAEPGWKVLFGK